MLTRASFAIFLSVSLSAQTQGTITTYAGNGTSLYSNDGGQATSTGIGGGGQSLTVALDSGGNLYIADQANDRVRRVSSGGSISTFAGGGSASGLGDGGQATNAKVFPNGIAIESLGNVFIASGAQVRKVATNGIITTIAGTGIPGNSGDGGAATSAQFQATSVAVDGFGNLYIADALANRIRKVNSVGVISTFAGIGAGGFSGDGGPATAARLQLPQGVAADAVGNAYFVDSGSRIRKVNAVGIISTYGGNGSPIGLGEGITATATGMTPSNVVLTVRGISFTPIQARIGFAAFPLRVSSLQSLALDSQALPAITAPPPAQPFSAPGPSPSMQLVTFTLRTPSITAFA